MGLPAYGRGFKTSGTAPGAPSSGPSDPGPFTGEGGFMAYYEICDKINNNGWTAIYDDNMKSMYAHGGGQWMGYENKQTLAHRCDFINERGLGGAMFWDTSLDDMRGLKCSEGAYPLISMFLLCLT